MNLDLGLPRRGSGLVGGGQTSKQTMPSCYKSRQNRGTPGQEPESPDGDGDGFPEEVHFMLDIEICSDIYLYIYIYIHTHTFLYTQWNITQP